MTHHCDRCGQATRYYAIRVVDLDTTNFNGQGYAESLDEKVPMCETCAGDRLLLQEYTDDSAPCICDMRDLMMQGCKCGRFEAEMAEKRAAI